MPPLRIEMHNHASASLRVGEVALLSDPWFSGTAFSGGWGLRRDNPAALERASEATHLWISHWHSDHLHVPTLKALAARRPDLTVLANVSANFSMVERMRAFGFERVVPLPEREALQLAPGVEVVRYPTAGIDNMLHLRAGGWSVLNYNDCNLPAPAIRRLLRHTGPLDVVMASYNHAGKLFEARSAEDERRVWEGKLLRLAEVFGAANYVPFASSHYYRCAHSAVQNDSLMSPAHLEALAAQRPEVLVIPVGASCTLDRPGGGRTLHGADAALPEQPRTTLQYAAPVPLPELRQHCDARCEGLRRHFPFVARLVPPLRVHLEDHRLDLHLDLAGPSRTPEPGAAAPHVVAHSAAIADWLGRRFGDDTFFAGAHFGVLDPDTSVIERWALVTLLEASHLDPDSLLRYVRHADGLRFLWNRREEIFATLAGGHLRAGQLRL